MRLAPPALALLLLASPTAAAEPIAVLPLQASGLAARPARQTRDQLQVLLARRHRPLALQEVDRLLLATDLSCRTPGCLIRAARLLGVRLLVGGRLELRGGAGSLALWLFDAQRGSTAATSFGRGGVAELGQLGSIVLERLLLGWAESQPGPSTAPSTIKLDPGPRLQAVTPPRRRSTLRWLKWGTAGGAVVSIGIGAGLWAAGQSSDPDAGGGEPATLRDHRPPGIALAVVGVALAAVSAFCFWLDARPVPAAGSSL